MRVLDLGNGSYTGVTELKWEGVTLVHVSLTYPHELLRALVEFRHKYHSLKFVTGIFRRNFNGTVITEVDHDDDDDEDDDDKDGDGECGDACRKGSRMYSSCDTIF
jgi:hypothetical protein